MRCSSELHLRAVVTQTRDQDDLDSPLWRALASSRCLMLPPRVLELALVDTWCKKLSLLETTLDWSRLGLQFKVSKAVKTWTTWESAKFLSADGEAVTKISLDSDVETAKAKNQNSWVQQDMSFRQSTYNSHPSKRSQSTRRTKSTYAALKSFTAMGHQTWSTLLKGPKQEQSTSKRVIFSLESLPCAWAIVTRNQGSSDLQWCATDRCIDTLQLATTSTLSSLGLRLILFKVDKMYRTCGWESLSGADGVTLTSTLPEFKWQTIKVSHLSLWECQDTLSSLSLWNKRASKISRSSERKVMGTWEASKSSIAMDRLIWLVQTTAWKLVLWTSKRATFLLDLHFSAIASPTKDQDDLDLPKWANLLLSNKCLILVDHLYQHKSVQEDLSSMKSRLLEMSLGWLKHGLLFKVFKADKM